MMMTSTYEIPTRDGVVDLEKQVRDESGTMVERMMIVSKKT
jgi:hypothetical protein